MFKIRNNKIIRSVVSLIFLVTAGGFGLALVSRVDEVVSAQGILKIIGQNILIKSPFDGTLIKVFVEEGQYVNKGDLIIKFDDSNYKIELNRQKDELLVLEDNYKNQQKILKNFDILLKEGAISELSFMREKKELKNLNLQINNAKASISKIKILLSKSLIKSPINGTIVDLNITGDSYESLKGEKLLGIIPSRDLEAKVFVLNKDIGFVKPSMEVKIKVDSHPYTQFGYLYGIVARIGDDILNPSNNPIPSQARYPVYIKLEKQFLEKNNEKYIIRNGQSISASFKVRDKPFIAIFSDIFEKTIDSVKTLISKKSFFLKIKDE